MRIAINGFGRIGKTFLRTILADEQASKKLELVAINTGPAKSGDIAQMFKYDSVMGTYPGSVEYRGDTLHIKNQSIQVLGEVDATKLPWKHLAVDWVVDCSGHYTNAEDAQQHIQAGAGQVLISAPGKGVDCTVIRGVNDEVYKKGEHTIVSLGSCTTNALMPILKIIAETTGIETAMVVSTHAYTNSQKLLDSIGGNDPRKMRAAGFNIIPTSTGAAGLIGQILPELDGKVNASALRVPVPTVSLLDVTWVAQETISESVINKALKNMAAGTMQGVLDVCNDQLVSSDYIGNNNSVVVDTNLSVINGKMGKLCGWYDNEWGYSVRLKDFLMSV